MAVRWGVSAPVAHGDHQLGRQHHVALAGAGLHGHGHAQHCRQRRHHAPSRASVTLGSAPSRRTKNCACRKLHPSNFRSCLATQNFLQFLLEVANSLLRKSPFSNQATRCRLHASCAPPRPCLERTDMQYSKYLAHSATIGRFIKQHKASAPNYSLNASRSRSLTSTRCSTSR